MPSLLPGGRVSHALAGFPGFAGLSLLLPQALGFESQKEALELFPPANGRSRGRKNNLGSDLQRNQDFFFFDELEILFFYFIFIFLY